MRWSLVLMMAVIAVPAAAAPAPNFDGPYSLSLTPKDGLDGPGCSSYGGTTIHVEKGQIQAGAGQASFSGTIDDKGLLDGHMRRADGGDVPFQANVHTFEYDPTRIHITGTIVDDKTSCGWDLSLVHD